jgi:hypothetical protein
MSIVYYGVKRAGVETEGEGRIHLLKLIIWKLRGAGGLSQVMGMIDTPGNSRLCPPAHIRHHSSYFTTDTPT